ncbi:fumarate hydratase [Fervidobacterium riparium]|uniref:Fumarate hydratase subunit alpha n=1 Tax=Fervidobacterium gondwanense DSM 13020 TaxID=1121883 RepID=A0A1M7S7Z8_FERGO|nr:fumarate hydratase [Fervidobacterium gondwanense]UXF00957.1 fumarate hydratase [Fervidobacterium riparium]SHN54747.1 fumarate hydratase subunit alpha [Fervidobacterium gondwanense DSM 13020]
MITYQEIYKQVCDALIELNTQITPKVEEILRDYTGPFSNELKENIRIARENRIPLCQDTGIVEFFVFKKNKFHRLDNLQSLQSILFKAVEDTYQINGYRKSVVNDPLFSRTNTKTNLPAVIHEFDVDETLYKDAPKLEIWIMVKGGGSENLSALFMLPPSSKENVVLEAVAEHIGKSGPNACPPISVGVGIGGTADFAMLLSRLALFEHKPNIPNVIEYTEFSQKLHSSLEALKIGVQGLGTGPSIIKTKVLGYPTHIATLPVAVSVDCYLTRTKRVAF